MKLYLYAPQFSESVSKYLVAGVVEKDAEIQYFILQSVLQCSQEYITYNVCG